MSLEELGKQFFPGRSLKTLQNMRSSGRLPPQTGRMFDVRDVSAWWEQQRRRRRRER